MRARGSSGSRESPSAGEASVIECDVCVVGSGPSAQSVVQAATAGGRSVLMLEAGTVGGSNTNLQHAIASATAPSSSVAPDPSSQVSFRVGGSLNLPSIAINPTDLQRTGMRITRLDAGDFDPRMDVAGWPIALADLEPHYRDAEAALGVGQAAWRPRPELPRGPATTHPFLVVDREQIARGGVENRAPNATLVTDAPVHRLVIDSCGSVKAAMVTRSDGSTLEVRASDFVLACGTYSSTRILLESAWSGGAHAANSSGLLGVGLTDHPQLHLGVVTLDSPSQWDHFSALAPSSFGTRTRWDSLVNRPTPVSVGLAGIVLPQNSARRQAEPRNRSGGIRAAQTFADGLRSEPFAKSTLFAAGSVAMKSPDLLHLALQKRRHRSQQWSMEYGWWGDVAPENRPSMFSVFALAEQLPHEANRVELSNTLTTVGWRRLQISWNWSASDRRKSNEAAGPLLDAIGSLAGRVEPTPMQSHVHKFSSHHPAGTIRMSAAPTDGVVNSFGQAHDHPNLWVVGAATFPTAGFATPTLTAMALGHRTGAALANRTVSTPPTTVST